LIGLRRQGTVNPVILSAGRRPESKDPVELLMGPEMPMLRDELYLQLGIIESSTGSFDFAPGGRSAQDDWVERLECCPRLAILPQSNHSSAGSNAGIGTLMILSFPIAR
jgi:hypothetical protein